MINLTGKDIQFANNTDIAFMFVANEKKEIKEALLLNKSDQEILEIADSKGYYFQLPNLKIALKNLKISLM